MIFFTFLLLSLTVARTTRLVTEDTILDEPRTWLLDKLWDWRKPDNTHPSSWQPPYLRRKLHYLLTCPWCCSAYVAGALIIGVLWFTDASMPLPLLWWPALMMSSVMCLEYTDGVKQVDAKVKLNQK